MPWTITQVLNSEIPSRGAAIAADGINAPAEPGVRHDPDDHRGNPGPDQDDGRDGQAEGLPVEGREVAQPVGDLGENRAAELGPDRGIDLRGADDGETEAQRHDQRLTLQPVAE